MHMFNCLTKETIMPTPALDQRLQSQVIYSV